MIYSDFYKYVRTARIKKVSLKISNFNLDYNFNYYYIIVFSKSNNDVMAKVPRTRGRILLELANELQENKEDTNTIIISQHQEPEPEYSADRKNNVLEWVKSNKFNVYENDDPQNSHSDSDNSTDEYNQSHISRSYVSDSVDLDSDVSSNILIIQEPIVVNRRNTAALDEYIEKISNKRNKKRTVCKFCKNNVTNFERHLVRHHSDKKEVKDLSNYSTRSKEDKNIRRKILSLLRYETQFEAFIQNDKIDSNRLPCVYCKRIVAVNYLRRHYKTCATKPINETGHKIQHRAQSQTLVACADLSINTAATLRLKNEVFAKMKADQISLVAKRDPLIRHFGENYLKKHKRAQISVACSNKMRECSRLLIEMRRHTEKKNLPFFDILNPMLFDTVVASARLISGYNEETKIYKAPSLAMHLGTTLKQICDLCSHLLMKDHPDILCNDKDAKLKELKRFKLLVNSQWSFEISSLAVKDLAEKKWNKPVLLPLTKDIIKFRNHVVNCAETNFELLQQDWTNQQAFKKVVDSALSLTILFNRRRIGDVQYVTIDSYLKNFACVDQTEYLEQLTESEKLLSNTYKRVVAGGKGSRPIIILFPKNVQAYIDLTLQIRNETNMLSKENQYLFSYPSSKSQWVRADVVIKKFANASGAENPVALTSNRLRKQIATVMQLINLSKEE
ncbi:uncharacterized protein [Diabrotica undecimpunctata]|uniref:uncharacterized protein isoform X1 n=1 Tax=Diabrotica undecimpunctata TaxID=50387 RepID=UPI003B64219B